MAIRKFHLANLKFCVFYKAWYLLPGENNSAAAGFVLSAC